MINWRFWREFIDKVALESCFSLKFWLFSDKILRLFAESFFRTSISIGINGFGLNFYQFYSDIILYWKIDIFEAFLQFYLKILAFSRDFSIKLLLLLLIYPQNRNWSRYIDIHLRILLEIHYKRRLLDLANKILKALWIPFDFVEKPFHPNSNRNTFYLMFFFLKSRDFLIKYKNKKENMKLNDFLRKIFKSQPICVFYL